MWHFTYQNCVSNFCWLNFKAQPYVSNFERFKIKIQPYLLVASQKLIKDKNNVTTEVINVGTEVSNNNAGLDLNGTLCDYEIICEGKKFSCHKAVLASNSKVFEVFSIYLLIFARVGN